MPDESVDARELTHEHATLRCYGGVDIGGTKTEAVVMDGTGRILGRGRVPTVVGPDGVVGSALRAIEVAARDAGRGAVGVDGVGIGVPGAVDVASGVVSRAVNLAVSDFPLADPVAYALSCPVVVDNDVNLAALGAATSLELASDASLAFLNIGTGMGSGIVRNGVILRGRTGVAGEVGHLPFDPHGPVCGCGLRGCLEVYASGSGLLRAGGGRSVSEIFAAAGPGDPLADSVVERFAEAVAVAVRILVQTVDVDIVVLGGGVVAAHAAFLPRVFAVVAAWGEESTFIRTLGLRDRIVVADLSEPLAAAGAALWIAAATPGDAPHALNEGVPWPRS